MSVQFTVQDHVARVTIDRPERLNAVTPGINGSKSPRYFGCPVTESAPSVRPRFRPAAENLARTGECEIRNAARTRNPEAWRIPARERIRDAGSQPAKRGRGICIIGIMQKRLQAPERKNERRRVTPLGFNPGRIGAHLARSIEGITSKGNHSLSPTQVGERWHEIRPAPRPAEVAE